VQSHNTKFWTDKEHAETYVFQTEHTLVVNLVNRDYGLPSDTLTDVIDIEIRLNSGVPTGWLGNSLIVCTLLREKGQEERKMTGLYGYTGKMLRVDLSSRSVTDFPTTDYSDRFLGGRGIAVKIYWDEVSPETEAFSPENRLIFVTGPLAGFTGIAGSTWQICGKSPRMTPSIPEFFSHASLVGSWGAYLKFAGYDGIVVQGRSDKPVYLLVQDGTAEIRDASSLWGKGAIDTNQILKAELGRAVRVVATGPAGDNMAIMATVLADDDASGSSGLGAVMGSKKLKAIAVRGSGKVSAAHPNKLRELKKHLLQLRKDAPGLYCGGYRTPFVLENPKMKRVACYGCISGCDRAIYRADDGIKGKFFCQVDTYLPWAPRYYGKLEDTPFHAIRLCNQNGVDQRAISMIIEWLRRCGKKGIVDDEGTGIPISELGSHEFIETLLRKIALREGFGDILAQGIYRAAELVGGGAEAQISTGTDQGGLYRAYGPRLYILTGLLYATEPRPSMSELHEISMLVHQWLDWCDKIEGAYMSSDVIRAVAKRFFGSELAVDFSTYKGKALAAKIIQDREYAKECAVFCDQAWPMKDVPHAETHVGDPTLESKVLNAVTGKELDEEEFYRIGERVFNLQRAILTREGRKGRQSDSILETDFTEPITFARDNHDCLVPGKDGEIISRKGEVVDRAEFEKMKDEYYHLRGWEVASGLQTKAKLIELGLQDIAQELAPTGLII